MKPVPWTLSEIASEEDVRSKKTPAKNVGIPYRVPQRLIEYIYDNFPVGKICEWAPVSFALSTEEWGEMAS